MKIIHKVTLQHMKGNRKKTFVTLLGIVLSMALMTAISSYGASFLDLMRRHEIYQNGNWHIFFSGSMEALSQIAGEEEVETAMYGVNLDSAVLPYCDNEDKPYLMVMGLDQAGMENLLGGGQLLSGRFPQNDGEILIPEHLKTNGGVDWQVGEEITLDFGDRVGVEADGTETPLSPDAELYHLWDQDKDRSEKLVNTEKRTYRIVGVISRPAFEGYTQAGYTAVTFLAPETKASAQQGELFLLMKQVDSRIYNWMEGYSCRIGTEGYGLTGVGANSGLLQTYMVAGRDSVQSMLNLLELTMVLIVMGGSISVIYSSFAISVSERSKYLGMLASIGATRRQKRSSVYYEAFLLGLAGIPMGLLVGLIGTVGTMQLANPLLEKMGLFEEQLSMRLVISLPALGGAALACALTIWISAWIPARRASRISPIDAIRQSQDVKLSGRQVKTSFLTRKLFGFEGELAMKNLKRNRKRYRAAILSLTVSIALFLGISAFSTYLADAYTMDIHYMDQSDLRLSVDGEFPELEDFLSRLSEGGLVSATERQDLYYIRGSLGDMIFFQPDSRPDQEEEIESFRVNGIGIYLTALDDEALKAYAKEIGADYEKLMDPDRRTVILYDGVYWFRDEVKQIDHIFTGLKKGDSVTLQEREEDFNQEMMTEDSIRPVHTQVTLGAVTTERPMGGAANTWRGQITLYMSRATLEGILKEARVPLEVVDGNSELYVQSGKPDQLVDRFQTLFQEWKEQKQYQIRYTSNAQERQQGQSLLLFMDIFIYGFIILTSFICATSIFNTISTSMALRKREYAMLQSVGMDGKQFRRMIRFESLFYSLRALCFGLPLGLLLSCWIYYVIARAYDNGFRILWGQIGWAVLAVFLIVGFTMNHSRKKLEKENIVDTLKADMV